MEQDSWFFHPPSFWFYPSHFLFITLPPSLVPNYDLGSDALTQKILYYPYAMNADVFSQR